MKGERKQENRKSDIFLDRETIPEAEGTHSCTCSHVMIVLLHVNYMCTCYGNSVVTYQ